MSTKGVITTFLIAASLATACEHAPEDAVGDDETAVAEAAVAEAEPDKEDAERCPSVNNLGHAYENPCQLALNIKHETRGLRAFQRADRELSAEYTLTVNGELNQLYPPPLSASGPSQSAPFLEFAGQARTVGESFRSPANPVAIDKFGPEASGSHPTTTEYQGDFSGPVTFFVIDRFEPRRDDRSSLCMSVGMSMSVTGEGTTRHTLADGSTVEEPAGPMGTGFTNHSDSGEWTWSRASSGLGPHEIIACEGPPPTGTSQDCEIDPRSYYGDEVCASEHLVACSSGDCQVDFGRGGWMIWYGLTANEDRTRWELNGEVSISDPDILKMQDAETTWRLEVDLGIVPRTLEYE